VSADFGEGGVFVLGGSGGLGGAICHAFARAGIPVAFSYHANTDATRSLAQSLSGEGVDAASYQLDAADRDAVTRVLDEAAERMGGLHSIVYAGGPRFTLDDEVRLVQSVLKSALRPGERFHLVLVK